MPVEKPRVEGGVETLAALPAPLTLGTTADAPPRASAARTAIGEDEVAQDPQQEANHQPEDQRLRRKPVGPSLLSREQIEATRLDALNFARDVGAKRAGGAGRADLAARAGWNGRADLLATIAVWALLAEKDGR